MPHGGVDSNDARCDTYCVPHGGAILRRVSGKGKRHVSAQGEIPRGRKTRH